MKCQVHSSSADNCPFYEFLVEVQADGTVSHPLYFEVSSKFFCIFHLPNNAKCPGLGLKSGWGDNSKMLLETLANDFVDYCSRNKQLIDFGDVQFPFELVLKNKELGDVNFSGAGFFDGCDFVDTKFTGMTAFISTKFLGAANFRNAEFSDLDCSGAIFEKGADFRHGKFMGAAIFGRCKFNRSTSFEASYFSEAIFTDAMFSDIIFRDTEIAGVALFGDAEFKGSMIFDAARIGDLADFSSSSPRDLGGDRRIGRGGNLVSFRNAEFEGSANFENRIFRTGANFVGAVFAMAPIFHGCTHHQGTVFPSRENFHDSSAESTNAYTTLKLAMSEMKRSREEGIFYALEQESIRNDPNTPKSARRASVLYGEISGYGQDFVRPWYWWLGLLFISWIVYLGITWINSPRASDVLSFAVKQSVFPFSAWRVDLFEELGIWNNWQILGVRILASIQSAVSLGLVAMSLLALRWRFRRP